MNSLSTALPSLGSHRRSESSSAAASPVARQGNSVRFADHVSITTISPATTDLTMTSSDHEPSPIPSASTSSVPQPTLESSRDVEMHYVVSLIKSRNLAEFKKWAREAPDVNLKDFAGNTPLHWACHKGIPEFVAILLRRGATLDAKNNNHATPLHCSAIAGVKSVIDILLQANADPSLRNKQGKTMFDLLRSKGHVHLDHAYEDLEDSVLARQAPQGAQAAGGDSWLDANRLGAESDTASSIDDGVRPSMSASQHSNNSFSGLAVGGPARRSNSGGPSAVSSQSSSSVVPLPPIYSMSTTTAASGANRGGQPAGEPAALATSPDTQAILRALERERLMLERRLQALEDRTHGGGAKESSPAARPVQQQQQQRQHPAPLRPSYLQQPHESSADLDVSTTSSSSYLVVGNTTVPLIASPPVGAGHSPGAERHTVPLVVKSGVSPRSEVQPMPLPPPPPASSSSSSVHSVSPQRFIGPTGRILCSSCDDGNREVATNYCEECRRSGDACWLCDACWKSEHSSKRTRSHRSGPVPIPQLGGRSPRTISAAATPSASNHLMMSLLGGGDGASVADLDALSIDLSSITPEARAYLMLQHQLIQALSSKIPLPIANGLAQPTRSSGSGRDRASRPGTPIHIGVQTQEPLQSTYFDEAMLELQDVREQLEAEVLHSQNLIDSTRLQLLEALELRHRSEIETTCWRKLLQVKRPPSVIVVFDAASIPPSFANLPKQEAGPAVSEAWARDKARLVNRSSSPPTVQRTASPGMPRQHGAVLTRRATNSQGVQCDAERFRLVRPTVSSAFQTEHTGDETPLKTKDDGSFVPRYSRDAVEVVHGEKHLPDQPQMLLVRWLRGGLESWIPAYEVAHCDAVVAYMSRYDKSFNNSLMMLSGPAAGDDEPSPLQNRSVSPMNETERTQLSQQLAALKRTGTAQGSRDSTREPSGAFRGMAAAGGGSESAAAPVTLTGGSAPTDKATSSSAPGAPGGVLRGGAGRQQRRLRDSPLSDLPPSRGVLPSSFQPTQVVPVDDDDELPLPPTEGNKVLEDLRPDDLSPLPPPTPDEDVLVKKYEMRLRELEAKQQELKALREVQVARITDLRAKQQLMHEDKRADVRRQYDAKASQLQQSQPEKLHPLESTTDKHAALILEELKQEVLDAEKHKKDSKRPSPRSGGSKGGASQQAPGLGKPPLPTKGPVSPQRRESPPQATTTAAALPHGALLAPQQADPLPAPGAPTFERKINRILYEQYFYNKAVAAQQQQPLGPHDSQPSGRPLSFEPRPSSLN